MASKEEIQQLIFEEAQKQEVPPEIALAIADRETGSKFDQSMIGTSGERGVFQLMEGTAKEMRVDPTDLQQNIQGGIGYLKKLNTQLEGDWDATYQSYNGGIGNYRRGTVSKAAKEYAADIPRRALKYKSISTGASDEETETAAVDIEEEPKAAPPTLSGDKAERSQELNFNVPSTPQGFSQVLLQKLNQPDFYTQPFADQLTQVADVYKAKPWGKDSYPIFKEVMNNIWEGGNPEEIPNIRDIVGAPPISSEDPVKETGKWKDKVIQDLLQQGVSPGVFGNKLDEYMDKVSQDEIDAYALRNQGFVSKAASTAGNLVRDVVKGAASTVAAPVAGVVRLGTGAYETADAIQNAPELLGKPSKSYLYETKEDGYLKLDENNQPIPRWQSDMAQTVGSVGAFLLGGFAAKGVGLSTKAVSSGLFAANALTAGNAIFKDVYEKTGSVKNAYVGSLFAIPAAEFGRMGQMAVISKYANPVASALSPYNAVKYYSNVFARNAVVEGASNAAYNAFEQGGKISQTGEAFNFQELGINAAVGAGVGGTIGAVMAPGAKSSPDTQHIIKPIVRGSVREQQTAVVNLQKFQVSPAQELVVPNSEAAKVNPDVLDPLQMTAVPGESSTTFVKKTSYLPTEPANDIPTLNKDIENLTESIVNDGKPQDAFTLTERLTALRKEYSDHTLNVEMERARLSEATERADATRAELEGVNPNAVEAELKGLRKQRYQLDRSSGKAVQEIVRQKNELDHAADMARRRYDAENDSDLKEIRAQDLQEARDARDAFEAANQEVFELPNRIIDLDADIRATETKLENLRRPTYMNDVSLKQANLAQMLKKRQQLAAEIRAEQERAQPKPEGEPKKVEPVQSEAEIFNEKEEVTPRDGAIKVNGKSVIPIEGKWYVLDSKGKPTKGGSVNLIEALESSRTSEPGNPTKEVPPLAEEKPVLPLSKEESVAASAEAPDGSIGAKRATGLKPEKSAQRQSTDSSLDPLIREALADVTYEPEPRAMSARLGSEWLAQYPSMEEAAQAFFKTPHNVVGPDLIHAGQQLRDFFNVRTKELRAAGNIKGAEAASALAIRAAERSSAMLNLSGQTGNAGKVFAHLDPEVIITQMEAVTREHDLPGMTEADKARVGELMNAAKESGGTVQQNYLNEVGQINNRVTKGLFAGDTSPYFSLWQANMLSDPSTQVVNIIGNASQLAGSAASFLATGLPRGQFDGLSMLQGFARGALKEGFDAAMLELHGIQTFRPDVTKADLSSRGPVNSKADFVKNAPKWMQKIGLNNMGYVFRALSAADAFFYKTAQEGMGNLAAYQVATKEGLSGNARKNRIAEILYNSKEEWNKANQKARGEVATAVQLGTVKPKLQEKMTNLRTWEILEAQRPAEVRNETINFASRNTFTNKPEGVIGNLVSSIQKFAGTPIKMPGGKEIRPFRYIFPFMNVAGNIANASLDYTPVGGYRAAFDSNLSNLEKRNALGKFMLGSVLAGSVYGMAKSYMDDKDPYFALYGAGPKDPYQNKLWKESGARAYSMKIGDNYIRYSETPLGILLGGIAGVLDAERYDKSFQRSDLPEAIAIAMSGSLKAFSDNSFLRSIGSVVKTVTGEEDVRTLDAALSPIKGFVPAAGLGRAVSKFVDDPVEMKNNFYAKLVSGIPFVQSIGTKPSLNVFGQPVERSWEDRLSAIGRFYSERVTDKATNWLAKTGYVIPNSGVTVAGSKSLKTQRGESLGAAFMDVLTPEERYELVEKSGPLIKERVLQYAERYGNEPFSDKVQEKLKEDIKKIRSNVKKKIVIGSIDDDD